MPLNSCYAHIVDSNDTQIWNDAEENLKIEFGYTPEKPIIDTFTNLQFSVTGLGTDEHVKDLITLPYIQ
ncbi:MAG: hypothetical protein ACRD93_02820 [Nitrososphaeraceae archaeon]